MCSSASEAWVSNTTAWKRQGRPRLARRDGGVKGRRRRSNRTGTLLMRLSVMVITFTTSHEENIWRVWSVRENKSCFLCGIKNPWRQKTKDCIARMFKIGNKVENTNILWFPSSISELRSRCSSLLCRGLFSLHSSRGLCMLVLRVSLRQRSSYCSGVPMWFCPALVSLPLGSPHTQKKHLISLHTCQTISPTQSHTLQSSLQQSIIFDALAQREKTTTKATRHWRVSS